MTYSGHKWWVIVGAAVALVLLFIVVEFLIIKLNGSPVPPPDTPRATELYGDTTKPALRYAVLGDSTTVGQGGDYDRGIARSTARHLADKGYAVSFQNFGVSGARTEDVADKQVVNAATFKPDVVLIGVEANDVTHFTPTGDIRQALEHSIATLRRANPAVVIVLTGSPQMGSVPRFPQPVKYFAHMRTAKVNAMTVELAQAENVTFARLADKTGPTFMAHPEYFAVDKFHPNTKGYDIWVPVLNDALDSATAQ